MSAFYGLVGVGGHGRETMFGLRSMLKARGVGDSALRFVVEPGYDAPAEIRGIPVLTPDQFSALPGDKFFNVAIGDGAVRQRISAIGLAAGWRPLTIISASSVVWEGSELGEGAMLSPFTLISTGTRIGKFFLANAYASVMHDCVIGDYVSLMLGVRCNGRVHIGDHVYIGSGAIIRNGPTSGALTIGEGAVIGMGAVVTKDVPPYTTVVGNPARELRKTSDAAA